jgi:2-(1,2-epoxy-1,2-dihydrophenyl)acetyl-CoA isomerase
LKAQEALEWGLVSRTVADDKVLSEAEDIVAQLAQGPTAAYGASARLLRSAIQNTLRTHLSLETASIVERALTADGLEGIRAFVERRPPEFNGE